MEAPLCLIWKETGLGVPLIRVQLIYCHMAEVFGGHTRWGADRFHLANKVLVIRGF